MKTLIIILLSILFATSAEAQTSDRRPISRWTLGLAAGVGGDEQSGTFIEPCGCTFKDGVGTAFHLAALSDYAISKCFRVGMGIGFNHEQTHSAADLTAPAILQGVQKK